MLTNNILRQSFSSSICNKLWNPIILWEGTTMPRRTQPDNGITNGQDTQKQHGQQQWQIKVVGLGCSVQCVCVCVCVRVCVCRAWNKHIIRNCSCKSKTSTISTHLNTTSCGTLHVNTIQDLKYIIIISFTKLMSTRPGEKNMPIHTCPWLFIRVNMFSAILKSPYWMLHALWLEWQRVLWNSKMFYGILMHTWGNVFSISQHHLWLTYRTNKARRKSMHSGATIDIICIKM